jgi:hypothetical protein
VVADIDGSGARRGGLWGGKAGCVRRLHGVAPAVALWAGAGGVRLIRRGTERTRMQTEKDRWDCRSALRSWRNRTRPARTAVRLRHRIRNTAI